MLCQPSPGLYGVALMRLQRDPKNYRVNLPQMVDELEMRTIGEALDVSAGNVQLAAELCGLNRTTLSQRLRKHPELRGRRPRKNQWDK